MPAPTEHGGESGTPPLAGVGRIGVFTALLGARDRTISAAARWGWVQYLRRAAVPRPIVWVGEPPAGSVLSPARRGRGKVGFRQ